MRVVVALPASIEDPLLAPLLASRHEVIARPGGAAELASVIDSTRPEIALVHASRRVLGSLVVDTADEVGCRLIVFAGDPSDRALAASLGIHEVVDEHAPWDEIEAMLRGNEVPPVALDAERPRGRVVTVWGPTGAPGRSTTAVAIAGELARAGERVALVDADSYGGAIAPLLGLLDEAPGFAAACRLAGSGGLDFDQLDRIAVPVPAGDGWIRVLTGLTRPSRWTELTGDRVEAALEIMRDWVDVIVIDTGFSLEQDEEIMSDVLAPRRNQATHSALLSADRVVAVGAADAISLARFIRGHGELIDVVPAERVEVIINRVQRSTTGFDASGQIIESLGRFAGIVPAALIPFDARAYDTALASARSLADVAPRSAARTAFTAFVHERLAPQGVTQREEPRTFTRPRRRLLTLHESR